MDIGIVVGIVGVGLAACSFWWQVASYRKDGPRVEVEVANSWPTFGEQVGDWHVTVKAVNRGRGPTTIESWGFRLQDGGNIHQLRMIPWSPRLPHRLEPHSSIELWMPTEGLRQTCIDRRVQLASLRSWVRLGSGQTVFGPPPPVADE